METKLLTSDTAGLAAAAALLKEGQVVGMPTETVYGLAANALSTAAVARIFEAKGRPQDNPLIVHIASLEDLPPLCREIPPVCARLAEAFWPGPMTLLFEKSELVPDGVTAGLPTVAVRFPAHPVAQALIRESGLPLAAPSANTSGKPSPTTAGHVLADLNGKIPAVLDGGDCLFGVESTVLMPMGTDRVHILRPGGVTAEQLAALGLTVTVDPGVLIEIKPEEPALSPGMKHKHYAPKTRLILAEGPLEGFYRLLDAHKNESVGALVFDGEEQGLSVPWVSYGAENDPAAQAHRLFDALRALDGLGVDTVYGRMPKKEGLALAVYNRILRAAAFQVVQV